jgi:hypothetical protein
LDESSEIRQLACDLERVDHTAQIDGDNPLWFAPLAVDARGDRGCTHYAGDTMPRRRFA